MKLLAVIGSVSCCLSLVTLVSSWGMEHYSQRSTDAERGVQFTIQRNTVELNFESKHAAFELSQHRRLSATSNGPMCEPVSECELCTAAQRENETLCKQTGRIQRVKCQSEEEEEDPRDAFKTCKRTRADEEFLMMKFQVGCFLVGSLALLTVRRHRAASLFEQRKLARRSSVANQEIEIEFSSMVSQQAEEMQPLRPIEIV